MKQIGLADAMIETYQQRSFNQIIQRYKKEGDYRYRQEIMHELLADAEQQFSDDMPLSVMICPLPVSSGGIWRKQIYSINLMMEKRSMESEDYLVQK